MCCSVQQNKHVKCVISQVTLPKLKTCHISIQCGQSEHTGVAIATHIVLVLVLGSIFCGTGIAS